MKALLSILALGAASVAVAAPKPAPAPAVPTYPQSKSSTSVNIGLDSKEFSISGMNDNNRSFTGIHVGIEHVIKRTPQYFVTVNGAIGYATSRDNGQDPQFQGQPVVDQSTDYSLLTAALGVDWNLKLGEQTFVYAGPRLGWAQYSWSPNFRNAPKSDSASYIGYGAEIGLRYFVTDRCSIGLSVGSMRYLEKDKIAPHTTGVSASVNWAF